MLFLQTVFQHAYYSLPDRFLHKLLKFWQGYAWFSPSFSQEGEDILLARIFERQKHGFYVDVGANHPIRLSNTYRFYLKGWRGINIEPLPEAKKLFDKYRKRDINLSVGISMQSGMLDYYEFNHSPLNTFSKEEAEKKQAIRGNRLIAIRQIPTFPLAYILEKHLPPHQNIDFLTIDTEGFDLVVLQSNDWTRFRPTYILVEALSSSLHTLSENPIYQFLSPKGYECFAKIFHTLFFKKVLA